MLHMMMVVMLVIIGEIKLSKLHKGTAHGPSGGSGGGSGGSGVRHHGSRGGRLHRGLCGSGLKLRKLLQNKGSGHELRPPSVFRSPGIDGGLDRKGVGSGFVMVVEGEETLAVDV